MITSMLKVSIVIYHRVRDEFLGKLQDNGLVHIIAQQEEVSSGRLTELQGTLNRVIKCRRSLAELAAAPLPPQEEQRNLPQFLTAAEKLFTRDDTIKQRLNLFEKQRLFLAGWGNFETVTIERLAAAGITTRFFVCPNAAFGKLDVKTAGYTAIISQDERETRFVVFERGPRATLDCEEVTMPEHNLAYVTMAIEENRKLAKRTRTKLVEFAKYLNSLEQHEAILRNQLAYEHTTLNLKQEAQGAVQVLKGWVPREKQLHLENFLLRNKVVFLFEEPAPDDNIPILLKNRKTFKMFENITQLFSLPDYHEIDPTPFFAPFFTFFFGMCLGDVGYGVIILLVSVLAFFKVKPAFRQFTVLGMALGGLTVFCGVLLNSFFGYPLVTTPDAAGIFGAGAVLAPLSPFNRDGLQVFPAMTFSLYVALIQITLGIVLQCVNKVRNDGWKYVVHPVSTIMILWGFTTWLAQTNFMDMGTFALGAWPVGAWFKSMPSGMVSFLFGGGIGILLLFNNPASKLWTRPLRGLWELYQFITGLISNGLSYLRLFALGLAGGLLGSAFNQIAFMFVTGPDGTVSFLTPLAAGTILVLVLGHTLNLLLSSLGAFVHPIRLTFVEFYGNVQFKGGGKPFVPFSKKQE